MNKVVITGGGPDQPGIVAGLAELLHTHGCNIVDSSMTILGGEFAMILIVSLPSNMAPETLQLKLIDIEQSKNLKLAVKPIQSDDDNPKVPQQEIYMLSVSGRDRTGITAEVSILLAECQINITDLNAKIIHGEGGPVYIMMVEIEIPTSVDIKDFEQGLSKLESELGLETRLNPLEMPTL